MPKMCEPLTKEWEHVDDPQMLGRLALEALGWRLWCEDDSKPRDHTHYVYWVGPAGEQDANWWAEGLYKYDPDFHWFPPNIAYSHLLRQYEYTITDVMIRGQLGYTAEVRTPWIVSKATDINKNIAVYSAILGAFCNRDVAVPDEYRPVPWKSEG
jgi:hypothetical protein